jgi:glycosyltransferase involved in cell wall biosynthesis
VLGGSATSERLLAQTRAVEAAAVASAVLVAGCSTGDVEALREAYGDGGPERFVVVPNGVDARSTSFTGGERRRLRRARWLEGLRRAQDGPVPRHSVLFMGSWHPPNVEAAERVAEIAESLLDVCFLMVGSHCLALDGRTLPDNVVLCGELPDSLKRSLLWSVDLGLNPVVRGSGTNLKLVEYFAAGLPALSTPMGARGLGDRPEEHLWTAPLEDFVAAIETALGSPDECAARAERARRLVDAELNWEVIGARYRDAVAAALA